MAEEFSFTLDDVRWQQEKRRAPSPSWLWVAGLLAPKGKAPNGASKLAAYTEIPDLGAFGL